MKKFFFFFFCVSFYLNLNAQFSSKLNPNQLEQILVNGFQKSVYIKKLREVQIQKSVTYVLDSCTSSSTDLSSGAVDSEKSIFQYDLLNRNNQGDEYYWDENSLTWSINSESFPYTIDYSIPNIISVYNNTIRTDYIFNNSNELIRISFFEFFPDFNFWFNFRNSDLTYQGTNLSSKLDYDRDLNDTSLLILKNKTIYSYSNSQLNNVSYFYATSSGDSLVFNHNLYYNTSNLIERLETFVDFGGGTLQLARHTSFKYNSLNQIEKQYHGLDSTVIIDYTYDLSGNLIRKIYENSNAKSLDVIDYFYDDQVTINELSVPTLDHIASFYSLRYTPIVYTYDGEYADQLLYPLLFPVRNVNKLDRIHSELTTISGSLPDTLILNSEIKYFYSQKSLGISPSEAKLYKLYPNPANNSLFIENNSPNMTTYRIYNSLGVLEKQGQLSTNHKVDVSLLNPGYYFIELKANDGIRQYSKFTILR